jgi:anti-sigma B factor antagonist
VRAVNADEPNPAVDWQPFSCDVLCECNRVRVVPVGEVDLLSAPELTARLNALLALRAPRIVLDLGRTTFIDSRGLRAVLAARVAADAAAVELTLEPAPPPVQRIFAISGVEARLFDTAGEAPGTAGN